MAVIASELVRHFEGVSFSPERRAAQAVADLEAACARVRDRAFALAVAPDSAGIAAETVEKALAQLERAYTAMWAATGRTISPMITGPANFPVRRNQKAMETERRRWEDVVALNASIDKRFAREAFPHGMGDAIRGDDPEALDKLKAKLASGVKYAERKRLEGRIANLEVRQERGRVEREAVGFRVIEDPDLDRIQLIFAGKPDEATRAILKRRGFRWAPSHGAWQRHLNTNGRNAARFVESDLAKAGA